MNIAWSFEFVGRPQNILLHRIMDSVKHLVYLMSSLHVQLPRFFINIVNVIDTSTTE